LTTVGNDVVAHKIYLPRIVPPTGGSGAGFIWQP